MQAKSGVKKRGGITVGQFFIRFRTIIILIVIMGIFTALNDVFINPINLLNMLKRQSFVFIVGFGMTFVITLAGLDLSVGGGFESADN